MLLIEAHLSEPVERILSNYTFRTDSCAAFFAHWRSLAPLGAIPHSRKFLDQPPFQLLSSTTIFEVAPSGATVRFMGANLVDLLEQDLTGCMAEERIEGRWRNHFKLAMEIVTAKAVGLYLLGYTPTTQGRAVQVETVTLPLAVEQGREPRCARFSQLTSELHRDEHKAALTCAGQSSWINLDLSTIPNTP